MCSTSSLSKGVNLDVWADQVVTGLRSGDDDVHVGDQPNRKQAHSNGSHDQQ
jgi:hypothetical protein